MSVVQGRVRPRGLQLIILYKLIKAPVVLALALFLIFRVDVSSRWLDHWALELASGAGYFHAIGLWMQEHLGVHLLRSIRWLALFDGVTTLLEAILLIIGKSWGEWLVVGGVAALIPAEIHAVFHRFSWIRLIVLVLNTAVAIYLLRRRLRAHAALTRAAATPSPS